MDFVDVTRLDDEQEPSDPLLEPVPEPQIQPERILHENQLQPQIVHTVSVIPLQQHQNEAIVTGVGVEFLKCRVPRPANAFMLYANENRKTLAKQYPLDSNKEISKRLGQCWKDMDASQKNQYYVMAKQVDADHKRKYPNYVYNPKEARIRKAMRDASRERSMGGATPHSRSGRRVQPWTVPEPDDQMMMSPGGEAGMRAGMSSPMCGNGFPIASSGSGNNGQYMQPSMHGNYHPKQMHPLMAHSGSSTSSPGYLSNNPIAQLQHQTEMWHHYHQNSMRNSDPYMMATGHNIHPHHSPHSYQPHHTPSPQQHHPQHTHHSQEQPSSISLDQIPTASDLITPLDPLALKTSTKTEPMDEYSTAQQLPEQTEDREMRRGGAAGTENIPPPNGGMILYEGKMEVVMDGHQQQMGGGVAGQQQQQQQQTHYGPVYQDSVELVNPFEKATEEVRHKKELPNTCPSSITYLTEEECQNDYIRKYIQSSAYELCEIVVETNRGTSVLNFVTLPIQLQPQSLLGQTMNALNTRRNVINEVYIVQNEEDYNRAESNSTIPVAALNLTNNLVANSELDNMQ